MFKNVESNSDSGSESDSDSDSDSGVYEAVANWLPFKWLKKLRSNNNWSNIPERDKNTVKKKNYKNSFKCVNYDCLLNYFDISIARSKHIFLIIYFFILIIILLTI